MVISVLHSISLKELKLGTALIGLLITAYFASGPIHTIVTQMAQSVFKPGIFSVVYVTTPTQEVAKKIARGLVENQLAACVNIIPSVTSVYKWEGKIEEDSEILLMIKTRTKKIEELTAFVKDNHPYTVPEVISTPIDRGHDLYLKFLQDSVPE